MRFMRDPATRIQMLRTLHFALNVMEERSHIGLDEGTAGTVRSALLHQILKAETAPDFPTLVHTMENQSADEFLTA